MQTTFEKTSFFHAKLAVYWLIAAEFYEIGFFFSSFELVLINATHNYKELLLFIVVVKFQTHLRAAPKQKNNN